MIALSLLPALMLAVLALIVAAPAAAPRRMPLYRATLGAALTVIALAYAAALWGAW
ncbi:hypothetical protein [Streptomyces buecherae]|uniref:hypothetical protein n=1 Tax=Streptomyces buecherae TaxID=2763006 RepID=UPI00164E2E64|nr:hypothetical protein [Streptomyces buecherae]MBC3988040.1 hypothetical protein [Streptomyces buecherae]